MIIDYCRHNQNNWGSLIIAIDPKILGPIEEFQSRANIMCNRVKNAKKLPHLEDDDDDGEILLPGERGDQLEEQNLLKGSLLMSKKLYDDLCRVSDES